MLCMVTVTLMQSVPESWGGTLAWRVSVLWHDEDSAVSYPARGHKGSSLAIKETKIREKTCKGAQLLLTGNSKTQAPMLNAGCKLEGYYMEKWCPLLASTSFFMSGTRIKRVQKAPYQGVGLQQVCPPGFEPPPCAERPAQACKPGSTQTKKLRNSSLCKPEIWLVAIRITNVGEGEHSMSVAGVCYPAPVSLLCTPPLGDTNP